uniref:probable ATP-dependent RNA helicase DDX56 n=1 Tax=Styela clava TaxID=7725 RepID=UPI00193A7764|nr:probable ATP-dependent RNA helicase DDX56 [Styela clava]
MPKEGKQKSKKKHKQEMETKSDRNDISVDKDMDENTESKEIQECPNLSNTPKNIIEETNTPTETEPKEQFQFHEMGLDNRLLKAIASLKWPHPTLVQEKAIPLALNGKDILTKARTGSGKTAAYAIPIIQSILGESDADMLASTKALVLIPSKELSEQVAEMFNELICCCMDSITCLNLSEKDVNGSSSVLNINADVLIGTPGRILAQVAAGKLNISTISWLVIDEADLVLSFGYEDDIHKLVKFLPNSYQTFVTSATFSDDLSSLKNLVLKNPVTLQLHESSLPQSDRLTQYHVICESEDDKYLLLYALLKLRLMRGKTIIFVNSVSRCYRLKLFLEQFSIFCCILNSELPVKSRCHTVDQFNKDLYDYIIAADENHLMPSDESHVPTGKKKRQKKSNEFSVSRGVDFQRVANVLNFDFPESVQAYIHRVGRTARGFSTGTALSFVTGDEIDLLKNAQNEVGEGCMRPYQFAMKEIEGFRYRCRDAMRIVTKQAIKDARLRELRTELLNSEKLQAYFEENPRDLQILRHNTALRPSKVKPHMKHVPEYLIPETLKGIATNKSRKRTFKGKSRLNPKYKKRQEDPLKSFKFVKSKGD